MRNFNWARGRAKGTLAVVLALGALTILGAVVEAQSPYDQKGRWTHPADTGADWGHWPIHMVLLPGDDNYHSYVLSWFHDDDAPGWAGGLWGWNPDTSDDCAAYPDLTLVEVAQPAPPNMNIFCSGHSALGDGSGRQLVTGGTEFDTNGLPDTRLFDPQNGWVVEDAMEFKRYYPTNTTLPDGRILVTNGWQHFHMLTFGGQTTPGSAPTAKDEIQRLIMTNDSDWDASITDPGPPAVWPEERADHTAVANIREQTSQQDERRIVVFGGTNSSGAVLNDTWQLKRSQYFDDVERYEWIPVATDGSAPFRARHGAVFATSDNMYVFGGLNDFGVPTGTVHRMYEDVPGWHYEPITVSGSAPSARYGHSVAYDRTDDRSRMVVFGGRTSSGFADDDIYILDLAVPTPTWTKHSISGPSAREGHTLLVDPATHNRGAPGSGWGRMILYGGETASGLDDDVWMLWIHPTDPNIVEWEQVTPANDPSGPTPARSRHSSAWLSESNQIAMFGGDTGGTESDDGVWVLDVAWPSGGTGFSPQWVLHSDATDVKLSGHTAIPDLIALQALKPEIYDPSQPSGSRWSTLDAPKRSFFYPDMFVLPSGNVFLGGPDKPSYILKLSGAGSPNWVNGPWAENYAVAAVMYEPGKIMKCRFAGPSGNDTERIAFDVNDGYGAGWIGSTGFEDRAEHNLTILPNGKVIATGGFNACDTCYVRGPQIWDPNANGGNGSWTQYGDLASEPTGRKHHSAAILLPDGRILNGAEHEKVNADKRTMFCPPYLFTDTGLAARPTIGSAPEALDYGESFTIYTPDADDIQTVGLIKPAATTHEFNHDQRYVPLTFTPQGNPADRLQVTAPAGGEEAPPGYYLLFITGSSDNTEIPAIGQWVHLPDVIPPAAVSDLLVEFKYTTVLGLSWTAPGDDGTTGNATEYDLRYSTAQITEQNWAQATQVTGEPSPPQDPGEEELDFVENLTACQDYWFAIKTRDENGNWSPLGTADKAKTGCGGGGLSAVHVPGHEQPSTSTGAIGLSHDQLVVDISMASGGPAWTVAALDNSSLSQDAKLPSGIHVQVPDRSGSWRTLDHLSKIGANAHIGMMIPNREDTRVVFAGDFSVSHVAGQVSDGSGGHFEIDGVESSRLGDLSASVDASSGGAPEQTQGDTLSVVYKPSVSTEGSRLYVVVSGSTSDGATETRGKDVRTTLPPSNFRLSQNQPNPFRGETAIAFDLPVTTNVTLEVFDPLGRRVTTLADRQFEAGSHVVPWVHDRSDGRLRPGVYMYRIVAGAFTDRKKLIVLP